MKAPKVGHRTRRKCPSGCGRRMIALNGTLNCPDNACAQQPIGLGAHVERLA